MQPQDEQAQVRIPRWPTERPLLILNALAAAGVWFVLLQSPQSAGYFGLWFGVIFLMNLGFVAAVRGSAVRLGPGQFPELYGRVHELALRLGLPRVPDVYLMQQDGALNAFATRFMRTHMVVLLSDLLEACGDNTAARDMIIGHELGHIRAGHLRGRWLLMPTAFVPFLGSALSRAREYTCDRYGCAAAGDREGALVGLAILSAGARYGPRVNRAAMVQQHRDLRSTWMHVGEWLGSHPPLARRLLALAPELDVPSPAPVRTTWRALQVTFASAVVVVIGAAAVSAYLPKIRDSRPPSSRSSERPPQDAEKQVGRDLARLKEFIEAERTQGKPLPWDTWDLYGRWEAAHPRDEGPTDPFSGYWYDYEWHGDRYQIWSTGRDGTADTADDIVLESASGAAPRPRFVYKD
jgi:Zn-dependent protease with chaperone function